MAWTISIFVVLHTPVTVVPKDLVICTANSPMPPDAPLINTRRPAWTSTIADKPAQRRRFEAVIFMSVSLIQVFA